MTGTPLPANFLGGATSGGIICEIPTQQLARSMHILSSLTWTKTDKIRFAVSKDVSAETTFNLTCAAGSGAPATINTDLSKGVKKSSAAQLMGSVGIICLVSVLSAVVLM